MMTFEEVAEDLIKKPTSVAIISDVNNGKSMLNYNLIDYYSQKYDFNISCFGNRINIDGSVNITTTEEVEACREQLVDLDEFDSMFELEDRKKKKEVEKTLRLINHNNNILFLIGLPRNFNKFVSASIDKFIFLGCSFADFINGSPAKRIATNYKGYEAGSSRLSLNKGEGLYFDGKHYHLFKFPYNPKFDTKLANKPIFTQKCGNSCPINCENSVPKNVEKTFQEKSNKETITTDDCNKATIQLTEEDYYINLYTDTYYPKIEEMKDDITK